MNVHHYLRVDPDAPIPLATQLSQQLEWLIASDQIQEGDQLPPVRSLARDLNINYHTVRAAYQQLSDNGIVKTRRGARATVQAYDHQHLAARAPDLPTFTVGVLLPNYSPYYAPFLQGLEVAARDAPWLLFMCDTHYYSRNVTRLMNQLIAKNVDGIIVTHFEMPYIPELRATLSTAPGLPPMVYADTPGMDGPSVLFDREGGASAATKHLLEHGHRRIGVISPPANWMTMREVHRGHERALAAAGIDMDPDLLVTVPNFELASGAHAAAQLLELPSPPSAIFATGDMLALGAIQTLKNRGLRVPEDIAVVGYGEFELAALVDPPLTTVSLSAYEMGVRIMQMLQQLLEGQTLEPAQVTIDTQLVIRRSCGCAPQEIHQG
jgi:DNA-binding LacI/PurR family transcriptional regulator